MAKKSAKRSTPGEIRYRAVCTNCGTFIPVNSGLTKDGKNYCDPCCTAIQQAPIVPPPVPVQPQVPFTAPSRALKVLCYILSLSPMIGFLLGVIYFPQNDPALKKFGRNAFIMMGVGIFLAIIFFIIVLAAGAALGGGVSGANFGEGYY